MRRLSAALVVVAILAADVLADMGLMGPGDNRGWDRAAGVALGLFVLVMLMGDDE